MITRQQVDQLIGFQNGEYLITSCYLNLDRAQSSTQELRIRSKDLLQTAGHDLAARAGTHAQRESLRRDFQRIEELVLQQLNSTNGQKGLAVFSCAGQKFLQTYPLPRISRNILVADHDPYIRPLTAILEEYHRYCTVVADRVHGRIFEVYMGELLERSEIIDQIPRKVREGGLGGREERNIERRHDHAVQQHYQHLADVVFEIFKRDHFDWLILGGHKDVLAAFEHHLHPYLKQRLVGSFAAEPGRTPVHEVLARSLETEERVEREHERRYAEEAVQKAQAGDLAVVGLRATLNALVRGEAQMLLVETNFESPGFFCYQCHFVGLDPTDCPQCLKPFQPCPDIVDAAIELALARNCRVEHIHDETSLREAGRIGALLRFRA